jgi:AGCS family alanine or glycine:cation symporter
MWVSATVAMLLKYAEIVLALGHRRVSADGARGGAMYYMEDAFAGKRAWIGRLIAGVFAALCLINAFGMGCVVQVNAMSSALNGVSGFPPLLLGLLTALIVFVAGLGGARVISGCTERLVPLMTVGFAVISLIAIGQRAADVPALLGKICTSAFAPDTATQSALGGVGGFLLSRALRFGTIRGLLSNEAGCGTSPMAHATADTDDAAAQGCLGIVEVFVDTHVLCTMTALVVLLAWDQVGSLGEAPMLMTLRAYEALLGRGAGIFLAISVLFFGLATLLCWSHYAAEACAYLVGERAKRSGLVRRGCLVLYCAFCAVGAVSAPPSVWTIADFSIGMMTLLNLVVLCRLHREVEERSQKLI